MNKPGERWTPLQAPSAGEGGILSHLSLRRTGRRPIARVVQPFGTATGHGSNRGMFGSSRRRPVRVTLDDEVRETVVSFANKLMDKAQELRGRIKRNTGEVTGSRRLQAEGRVDEVMGNLKLAGEKVKDAFRGRDTRRRRY